MNSNEKQLHIRLKAEVFKIIKIRCASEGCSIQDYVENLISKTFIKDRSDNSYGNLGNPNQSKILKLLQECQLFKHIEEQELEKLASVASIHHFTKGEAIYRETQIPHSFHIVHVGLVKVFMTYSSGKEYITSICHDGESFGVTPIIQGRQYNASAIALVDTDIVAIPTKDFLTLMESNTNNLLTLTRFEISRISQLYSKELNVVADNANQRIKKVLGALHLKFGNHLNLTHKEISDMSNTTLETTTRVLGKLKNNGIIELHRGIINILDKEKL